MVGLIIKVKPAVIQHQCKLKSHRFSSKIQYLAATQKRKGLGETQIPGNDQDRAGTEGEAGIFDAISHGTGFHPVP